MGAIMIRLHASFWIRDIDMKRIQVRADILNRFEILRHGGPGFQDGVFCCWRGEM